MKFFHNKIGNFLLISKINSGPIIASIDYFSMIYNILGTFFRQNSFLDILILSIVIYIFSLKINIIKSYSKLLYKYKSTHNS